MTRRLWLWKWAYACWTYETARYPNKGPPAFPMQIQGNTCNLHCTSQESSQPEKLSNKNGKPLLQKSCGKQGIYEMLHRHCFEVNRTDTLSIRSITGPGQSRNSNLAPDFAKDRVKLTQLLTHFLQQADILKDKYHRGDMSGLRM